MGSVLRATAGMQVPSRSHEPQVVKLKNHPPYAWNKAKRCLCGNPVKSVIDNMQVYPHTADLQESSCEKLRRLAAGRE